MDEKGGGDNNNTKTGESSTKNKGEQLNGRKRHNKEDGFEQWGGYMGAKRAKLDEQFHKSNNNKTNGKDDKSGGGIFSGYSIHINGWTDPPDEVLRKLFTQNGGKYTNYNNGAKTSYVIATNLSAPSKRLYGAKTLRPQWITESVAAGKLLDPREFFLYDLNKENKQNTLSQFIRRLPKPSTTTDAKSNLPSSSSASSNSDSLKVPSTTSTSIVEKKEEIITISSGSTVGSNEDVKTAAVVSEDDVSTEDEDEFFPPSDEEEEKARDRLALLKLKKKTQQTSRPPPIPKVNGQVTIPKGSSPPSPPPSPNKVKELPLPRIEITPPRKESPPPPSSSPKVNSPRDISPEVNNKAPLVEVHGGQSKSLKNASEEGFLEEFFANSRLHLISSHKKQIQNKIGRLRQQRSSQHEFPLFTEFSRSLTSDPQRSQEDVQDSSLTSSQKVLMHIDLDCFFVSVGLLSRPHLIGLPVVVTHSTKGSADSKADIASASYEARSRGVRNGMWVGEAKTLCPELNVIPYDFKEYKRISELFFMTVAKLTLDIEVASVDEMIADVTSVLERVKGTGSINASPIELAEFIRRHIKEATQCTASIGIGSNRLLAKLATKKAKPDGSFHLLDSHAPEFIGSLEVGDLPGVGYSTREKLRSFEVFKCSDLLSKLPHHRLTSIVGHKTATKLLEFCKGKDSSDLSLGFDRPKSLSVDVNFGIRFESLPSLESFLGKLVAELSSRAEAAEVKCRSLTLKILTRRKGAGAPLKHGGHGIVDASSKSTKFHGEATRSVSELERNVKQMMRDLLGRRVEVSDLRGIGLTMSDLTFDFDLLNENNDLSSIARKRPKGGQLQIMEAFSRGRQMLEQALGRKVAFGEKPKAKSPAKPTTATSKFKTTSASKSTNFFKRTPPKAKPVETNKEEIDVDVLRELPRDIRKEVASHYGIDFDLVSTPPCNSNKVKDSTSGATAGEFHTTSNNAVTSFPPPCRPESPQPGPSRLMPGTQAYLNALANANKPSSAPIQLTTIYDTSDSDDDYVIVAKKRTTTTTYFNDVNVNYDTVEDNDDIFESSQVSPPPATVLKDPSNVNVTTNNNVNNVNVNNVNVNFGCESPSMSSVGPDEESIAAYMNKLDERSNDLIVRGPDSDPDEYDDVPKTMSRPSLSGCVDVADVRNLIRRGIQVVPFPSPEDVEDLHKYFLKMIESGWILPAHQLLKFLQRTLNRLNENDAEDKSTTTTSTSRTTRTSPWPGIIQSIISKSQAKAFELHKATFDLTDD